MQKSSNRSEEKFRSLFENSPYGIFQSSANGDRFLIANPALVRMLGYASSDELARLRLSKSIYVTPSDRSLVVSSITSSTRFEGDLEWKRKDGSPISVRLIAHSVPETSGGEKLIEGTVEDLTAKKALEDHLQRIQHLDSIGGLAGGMAHELNNLHMVISSYAEMLLPELQSAAQKRKADAILHASRRASALIYQLLAFSRKQTLTPQVLDTARALNEIAAMLRGVIRENISVNCHCQADLGSVRVDPVQLQEALINLASNASDAMPNGGNLIITAQNVNLRVEEPVGNRGARIAAGNYVLIKISDTGMGMDQETQARVFEPFFTTKPVGEGTGLGLSSAYGIVKQSGGWIKVESHPRQGTTFTIYLPRIENTRTDRAHSAQRPVSEQQGSSATVLLVEDEAGLREPVRDYLTNEGYRVLEAANGAAALHLLESQGCRIDALITDVIMPQVNGPELAVKLKQRFPDMKVIFISGYAEDKLGGSERFRDSVLLQKPFTLRSLKTKLQEALPNTSAT
ncbi:MAG TPA: ATP-binding protein [Terriglobales bacterium]|nr:ATP-binding protein [Terriglobales bacterium]